VFRISTPFMASSTAFAIETLELIEGDLPNRAERMIKEWGQLYQQELLDMWRTQQFRQLPGLE